MNQYIEYIRQAILETINTTKDEETLQLIYGILMNSTTSECSSAS